VVIDSGGVATGY